MPPITQISARQASELMQSGHTYVDVRTPEEYDAGHAAGAVNVPAFLPNAMGQMTLNPDFLPVMEANFAADAWLAMGCRSGGRSMRAAELLAQHGFTNVSNIAGGFGGAKDPFGRLVAPGWIQEGLPVDKEAAPGASYADLRQRAAKKA
jgi:rhodanese-related sulfurtransferase